ncbi:MAG: 1-(5-phosphoribosyl)-5-[Selenomonadaceae bacterium]|nr:1-(5-phosphoribosyl)-5-[(5-phosphoribosylamino)methylideneamino]imidazole-4-carboxamide isomerase [Selenomonadaceae bacterium]
MLILPAIDILDGNAVRLTQGDFKKEFKYSKYPEETALEWQDAGAEFLHVVDLDGAKKGALSNIFTIKRILDNIKIPIEVGGGIRQMSDIDNLLDIGVNRVIIGSAAVEDPDFVQEAADNFGEQVVIGIDAREGIVAVHGWCDSGEMDAKELAARIGDFGISTIIYTDIARDGMLKGIDANHVAEIARHSGISVIASGGVTSLDDIRNLKAHEDAGIVGAVIGKALYEGVIDFSEALKIAE